eukprot:COSAG01_NODE_1909_length_8928_cov_64.180315_10_plen_105_part_00
MAAAAGHVPCEAAVHMFRKNHNLRPLKREDFGAGKEQQALYEACVLLRCYVLMPCTCYAGTCKGCCPQKLLPANVGYLPQGAKGKPGALLAVWGPGSLGGFCLL